MGSDQKKIYYVIIASESMDDHRQLRRIINKMLPQAIVESIFQWDEFQCLEKKFILSPDLVFADHYFHSKISVAAQLKSFPLIVLGDDPEEFVDSERFCGNCCYFKRSFGSNSLQWLARNLLCKYNRMQEKSSFVPFITQ